MHTGMYRTWEFSHCDGFDAIAMVLTAHIAGQFIPSAIPNCPFATARARIAKTVTEK